MSNEGLGEVVKWIEVAYVREIILPSIKIKRCLFLIEMLLVYPIS